jgi:UDP-hydrolysing UDP-N-acetyl-D-glucosamine 2-epimerase
MSGKIKVCLPTGTRADFPRIEPVLELLVKDPRFDVQIAATGAHLLKSHGSTVDYLRQRYGDIVFEFDMFEDPPNDTPVGTSEAFAKCSVGFAQALDRFKPDVCLITVDRIETLAFASVAALMNYPILHIQGGEVSGTIDENIRHAVSKLSHFHSVANDDARRRVIQMGESEERVFDTGCPYSKMLIEIAGADNRSAIIDKFLSDNGMSRPYSIFCHHPVTTDSNQHGYGEIDLPKLIAALQEQGNVLVLTPNSDLGFSHFENAISGLADAKLFRNISPDIYLPLLCEAHALVGNSSSGIREACYFGTPVINIGNRQQGRLAGANVAHCAADTASILEAIGDVFSDFKRYAPEHLYGDEHGASRIIDILAATDWSQVNLAKQFNDMRV